MTVKMSEKVIRNHIIIYKIVYNTHYYELLLVLIIIIHIWVDNFPCKEPQTMKH